jgi:hypothetical protein
LPRQTCSVLFRRAAWRVRWSRSARLVCDAGRVGVEPGRERDVAGSFPEVCLDGGTSRHPCIDVVEGG